jgi:hypothetical protein
MLRTFSIAVFSIACMGTIVSIAAAWPYQFTGPGDPDRVSQDVLYMGTLLGPPLPLLVMFGVMAFLVGKRGKIGIVATIAMIPLMMTMVIGSLGEALSPASPDVPRPVQVWGGFSGAAIYLGLLLAATKALYGQRFRDTLGMH